MDNRNNDLWEKNPKMGKDWSDTGKSTAPAHRDRRLFERLTQRALGVARGYNKTTFDSEIQAKNYHEHTVEQVFKACDEVLYDFARENPGLPDSYPDPDGPLFSAGAAGSSRKTEYRMNFFVHLDKAVDAGDMRASGPFGDLVRELGEIQQAVEQGPERSTGCAVVCFMTAVMNLLLFGPGLGLPLPDFFAAQIGTNALFGWACGIMTVVAVLALLVLIGTDNRYEKGLFRLLLSFTVVILMMGHGVLVLWNLIFSQRVPGLLAMVGFGYYLILGLSVVISDRHEVGKAGKQWHLDKMRQYCDRWDREGVTARRYWALLKDWHRVAFPARSQSAGVKAVGSIIDSIQSRYDTYAGRLETE